VLPGGKARSSAVPLGERSAREWIGETPCRHSIVIVKALRATCLFVLCGILVAGLWPFHTPKNEVSWLRDGNGLLFNNHGSITSAENFSASASKEGGPCSLEIWLKPAVADRSGVILAYYQREHLAGSFELGQSSGNLMMRRTVFGAAHAREEIYYVDDLFRHAKSVFVTISSGAAGTTVYADGALVKKLPNFRLSSQGLTGQLLIGNAPTGIANWSGQLKGLAVYGRELKAREVSQHYANWTKNEQPDLVASEGIIALYLFNEGSGKVVRNQVDSATNLLIPAQFFVLRELFLRPFWLEFRWRWSYLKDVVINIAGFIPLGFFFCAYLSLVRRTQRSAAITITFGFALSLMIEVLQAFLPTRDSGTTDLITNTFGTALGVILYGWSMRHNWLTRAGISIEFFAGETGEDLQMAGLS
jgi:hypothetical protein